MALVLANAVPDPAGGMDRAPAMHRRPLRAQGSLNTTSTPESLGKLSKGAPKKLE